MKKIFGLLVVLFCSTICFGQEGATIKVTPFIPAQGEPIPSVAMSALTNKLARIITVTGMSQDNGQRFALMPRVTIINKQVMAGAPPKIVMEAEITYYFGCVESGDLFCSVSKTYKGIGQTEAKAYMQMINSINPKDGEIQEFMAVARQKVVEYYKKRSKTLFAQANAQASSGKYDEAIATLCEIPEECDDIYTQAMELVPGIYQEKINYEGEALYAEASSTWGANQTYEGAEAAALLLSQINPWSSAFPKAAKLTEDISSRLRQIEDREWDYQVKAQENEQKLKEMEITNQAERDKQLISAARDVAIEEAKRPVYNYNYVIWW